MIESSKSIDVTPKYEQLKAILLARIQSSELPAGARFPTQRELMASYNLSYSTVSRTLNDLVREGYITRELGSGSRVSERARAVLGRPIRMHLIGGVPKSDNAGLTVFRDLIETGRELGASVEPHEELNQKGREALTDRVLARLNSKNHSDEPEGLLFPYFAGNRVHIERLREAGAPYVVMDVPHPMPGYNIVLRDHRSAARILVERFLEAGHRRERIGLLLGQRPELESDAHQWDWAKTAGATDALGTPPARQVVADVEASIEAGAQAVQQLLRNAPQITAIFCDDPFKAIGACRWLVDSGRSVPNDVSLACMHPPSEELECPVPLAHAWAVCKGVGSSAAKGLCDLLTGRVECPVCIEIPMSFSDGKSIAAPRD